MKKHYQTGTHYFKHMYIILFKKKSYFNYDRTHSQSIV